MMIIISHNLLTVVDADRIVFLQDGRISAIAHRWHPVAAPVVPDPRGEQDQSDRKGDQPETAPHSGNARSRLASSASTFMRSASSPMLANFISGRM